MLATLELVIEEIKEVKSDVKDSLKILNGNGEVGLVARVDSNTKFREKTTGTTEKFLNYVYKITIGIILAYIATKVGLS